MMRYFLEQAKGFQRASVGWEKGVVEVSKADKKCKRVAQRSDWHSRVSDSVKFKRECVGKGMCDGELVKRKGKKKREREREREREKERKRGKEEKPNMKQTEEETQGDDELRYSTLPTLPYYTWPRGEFGSTFPSRIHSR